MSYLPGDLVYVFERHGPSSDARFLSTTGKVLMRLLLKNQIPLIGSRNGKWRKEVIDLVHVRYLKPAHKRVEVDAEK